MTTASMFNSLYHCGFCVQVSALLDAWKTRRKNRDGARQLEAMSDHALKDIRSGKLADHYRKYV